MLWFVHSPMISIYFDLLLGSITSWTLKSQSLRLPSTNFSWDLRLCSSIINFILKACLHSNDSINSYLNLSMASKHQISSLTHWETFDSASMSPLTEIMLICQLYLTFWRRLHVNVAKFISLWLLLLKTCGRSH